MKLAADAGPVWLHDELDPGLRTLFCTVQASGTPGRFRVVLTREKGKNDKMMTALSQRNMECIELPLIEHTDGPDR